MAIALRTRSLAADKTAGTTLAANYGAATSSGDLLIVLFAMDNAAGTVSAADPVNTSYSTARDETNASGVRTVVLYKENAGALTNIQQVTVTHPSVTARAMHVLAFSGAATASALDQTNAGQGTTTTTSSGSVTPSQDNELVIGCCGLERTSVDLGTTPPTGFDGIGSNDITGTTGGGAAGNISISLNWNIQTTAAARTYDPTNVAGDWANCIATFKAPSTGTKAPPPRRTPYRIWNRRAA